MIRRCDDIFFNVSLKFQSEDHFNFIVIFSCDVGEESQPGAQWFFEGSPLEHLDKYVVTKTDGVVNLFITNVSPDDIGEYQLKAGQDKHLFLLSVDGHDKRPQKGEKTSSGSTRRLSTKDSVDGPQRAPVNVAMYVFVLFLQYAHRISRTPAK